MWPSLIIVHDIGFEETVTWRRITGPDISRMIAQERRPLLPAWAREAKVPHVFLNGSFACANTQLEQLTSDALRSPEPILACHLLDQCDRL